MTELHLVAVGPACLKALADSAASLGGALPLRGLKVSAHPRACFSADGESGGSFSSSGRSSGRSSGSSGAASRRACDAAALAFASKLIALPRLARLEVLIADLPPGAVDAITTAAACSELTKFVLSSPASLGGDALAAALARPATWPALEELSLCGVNISQALAAASLPALRALRLSASGAGGSSSDDVDEGDGLIDPGALVEQAGGGGSDNDDDDDGQGSNSSATEAWTDIGSSGGDAWGDVWWLASAPWWEALRELSLDGCGLCDLAPLPAGLVMLSLRHNRLADADACALAGARLPRLRSLDLADNAGIGPRGAAALARSSWLSGDASCGSGGGCSGGLQALDLSGCPIGDDGVAALAAAAGTARLRVLYLARARVGDAGLAALACSFEGLTPPALEKLDLSGGSPADGPTCNLRLGRDGAAWRKLAAAPLWRLRELDLRRVLLGGPAAAALVRARWLPRLHALRLPESLESDAVAALMHSAEFRALRDAGRAVFGDSADLPPVPRRRGRGGGGWGGGGHDDDGDGDEGNAVWDGAGLVEEALGAAAVAAAATVAVAMALATAGGRR
jgi:hypothetical protein